MKLLIVIVSLLSVLNTGIHAQTESDPVSEAQAGPKLNPKAAHGAGFEIRYDGLFDPHVIESSNSIIYGFSMYRNSIANGIYALDTGMPLVRLVQTIAPLSAVGTQEQLLQATITDTENMFKQLLENPEYTLPEPTDTTRLIANANRKGKRYDLKLDTNGTKGFVECFAFEDASGHGVGIVFKSRKEKDDTTHIHDTNICMDILNDLTIKPLSNETLYTAHIAEYPILLPVFSKIDSTKQLNEYAIEASVSLEKSKLTIQLMNIPQGYSLSETVTQQLDQYVKAIRTQPVEILWKSDSHIPAGPDQTGLVDAMVLALKSNNQTYYNALYSMIDEQIIMVANFTAGFQQAEFVSQTAHSMFHNPRAKLAKNTTKHFIPGFTITVPNGYRTWDIDEPSDAIHTMYIAPHNFHELDRLKSVAFDGISYTKLQILPNIGSDALTRAHQAICEEELNRHRTIGTPATPFEYREKITEQTLDNGQTIRIASSKFMPHISESMSTKISPTYSFMSVTSYELIEPNAEHNLILSCVSKNALEYDANAITKALIKSVELDTTPNSIELDFGSVDIDQSVVTGHSSYHPVYDEYNSVFKILGDEVQISTSEDNPRNAVYSKNSLTSKYIKDDVWNLNIYENERSLYPENVDDLVETTIAGHKAVMFEATLQPTSMWTPDNTSLRTSGFRKKITYIRIYGFLVGNRYTTIVIRQEENIDKDRADRIAAAFRGK